ncbi:hypothetical protein L1F30_04215 [Simiduia sp. 21SJ11W-1]|uniref:class I SAM-dependent methyltransferase n=1 Tax=Simiduia sp. 21SJ11W-1 TaxID=2909669 RepID=UPI00209D0E72|nr:hypothetical protein [Simiduia sp. 21SJ11W-1]UTA48753.1 hypothetical protein L1F30_04215 [Simiduia sp. 21SJ11W-1]
MHYVIKRVWLQVLALALLVSVPWGVYASSDDVQGVLAAADRSEADRARDQRDKAAELIAWMNIKPGFAIADIFAGGGYWSELFAAAVGPAGKVLVHNNAAYRKFVGPDVGVRFEGEPTAAVIHDREVADLGLGSQRLDLIYMGLSFHDLYFVSEENSWPAIDDAAFIQQLYNALKPGGRLVIVDHHAKAGTGVEAAQNLHRIEKAFVIDRLTTAGFTLHSQSALLENATDDLGISVFDKSVRGKSSRFILAFEKLESKKVEK